MSAGGKGSARRPGTIPDDRWDAIFGKGTCCDKCRGSGKVMAPALFGLIEAKVPCSCASERVAPPAPAQRVLVEGGATGDYSEALADVETDLKGIAG